MSNNTTFRGKVKWFNSYLGYGFITYRDPSDGKSKDIFIHFSEIKTNESFKKLETEEIVRFDIRTHKYYKKDQAFNVQPIN